MLQVGEGFFRFPIVNDRNTESNEYFRVVINLSSFSGGLQGASGDLIATVTIVDDDSLSRISTTQTFIQPAFASSSNRPVHILWVIDDSGSMGSYQNTLARGLDGFIHRFVSENVHFNMAIINTGKSAIVARNRVSPDFPLSWDNIRKNENSGDTGCGRDQTRNFINEFKCKVKLGSSGSSNEVGLERSEGFLKGQEGQAWLGQAGYEDSYVAIVFLSDENDHSKYTKAGQSWKSTWREGVRKAVGLRRAVTVFSVVKSSGKRYIYHSKVAGGVVIDIKSDFGLILNEVLAGRIISDIRGTFMLDYAPLARSLSVTVDGNSVDSACRNLSNRVLSFHKSSSCTAPSEGAVIVVRYQHLL